MEEPRKTIRGLSLFLLGMGALFAILLTIFGLWPDLEASLFDTNNSSGEQLRALRCPVLITPADEAMIRLKLTNPLDQPINFLARANISQGLVTFMRQENRRASVEPGESVEFTWSVQPEDAVYGRMVLARVRVLRTNVLPARQKACGIMILDVPFLRGNQIIGGLLAATLFYLVVGGGLWLRSERPLTERKREQAQFAAGLILMLLLTMTFSLIGWWGSGAVIILITFLILIAYFDRFNVQRRV